MRDRKEAGEKVRGGTGQNIGEEVFEQETMAQKKMHSHKKSHKETHNFLG